MSYSNIICGLCERDLINFSNLKKDLSMKQQYLYDFEPILDPSLKDETVDYDTIVVEALDDEAALGISDELFEDLHQQESQTILTKNRRKQSLVTTSKKSFQTKEKLHCIECGAFLATSLSLKRHIDRVTKVLIIPFCSLMILFTL